MREKGHLPLLGVGPIIIAVQIIITVVGIAISYCGHLDFGEIQLFNIPLKFIGFCLICFGIYLNYSAVLLMCTGAICMVNNLVLLLISLICWIYMAVFLKLTEEKWLTQLYGQEYIEYCKRVNRCIPWFSRSK